MEMDMEDVMEIKGDIGSMVPPRLEDAGLEDCALPAQGITEAFIRAAEALRAKASSVCNEDEGGECIQGSRPSNGEWGDSLLDDFHSADNSQSCVGSRVGGLLEESKDKLINVGDEGIGDEVVDAHISQRHLGEEGASCVAGLQGIPVRPFNEDADDDGEGDSPILTETYA